MAAYYKVEVSLGTNAVEVGIPSPQSVNVVLPLIGPAGPQGAAGAAGATGAQGPQGVPGTGLEVLTTQGDLLYQGASTGQRLPIGSPSQILKVSAGGIPEWGAESGAVSSVAGRTGAVTLAVADVADAVATSDARLSDARTPSSTLAHASTHHTGGTDAIAPNNIGAAWALETRSHSFNTTSTYTLAQGRNVQLSVSVSALNATGTVILPRLTTDSAQNGDDLFITLPIAPNGGSFIIQRYVWTGSGYIGSTETAVTTTEAGAWRFRLLSGVWTLQPAATHTQPASTITGLPAASTATPSALGVASAGTSADFARADHVHGMPSAADVGLGSAADAVFNSLETDNSVTVGGDLTIGNALIVGVNGVVFDEGGDATTRTNLGLGTAATEDIDALPESLRIVGGSDPTKKLAFEVDGITTATTRTLTVPDASGTIARTEDFAAPPAIGNTTPNSGAFTTLSASGTTELVNGGTTAGPFRLYNTYTNASNHERGFMRWSSNVLQIGTEKAGTGSARALVFQTDGTTRFTIQTDGQCAFASNASANNYVLQATGALIWAARFRIHSDADGLLRLSNNAQTDFGRLQFGGTTSSFPSLKRSTTALQARLADDTDFTAIQGKLTTETAYTAGAPTPTGYLVLYDSNGTAYKVSAEAL